MTPFPHLPRTTRQKLAAIALAVAMAAGCAGVVGLPVYAQTPQVRTAQADLATVQRHIRAISTMTADFSQTSPNGQVQTGRLLWKQPGQIRFEYEKSVPLLIVADGRSLYMIDYEVSQVQRWPIGNSPLGALLDPKRDLVRYGKLVDAGDPRIVSVHVRDPDRPEYGMINLVFQRDARAPAGLELYGWVAQDAQGNRTNIRLIGHRYGVALPAGAFKWRDPRPDRRGGAR